MPLRRFDATPLSPLPALRQIITRIFGAAFAAITITDTHTIADTAAADAATLPPHTSLMTPLPLAAAAVTCRPPCAIDYAAIDTPWYTAYSSQLRHAICCHATLAPAEAPYAILRHATFMLFAYCYWCLPLRYYYARYAR